MESHFKTQIRKVSAKQSVSPALHRPELLDEAVKNQVFIIIQGAGD